MTIFIEAAPDTFSPWHGEPINGVRHQKSIGQKWSAEDLAAIGLYKPEAADPIPEGKISTGRSVQRVEGVVKWVHDLDDAPAPDPQAMIDMFKRAIEAHVDAVAGERDYSGAVSIATYVSSTNAAWAAEAQAFIAWRDAVWAYAFAELAKVQNAERLPPETTEDFIAELPAINWP